MIWLWHILLVCVRRNATNIEDWGILPGTVDPAEKIDAPKTQEDIINKLKELSALLPANVRSQLFKEDKSVTEGSGYMKELQVAQARNELQDMYKKSLINDDELLPTTDNSYEDALDKDLDDIISYNPDSNFNISDWL